MVMMILVEECGGKERAGSVGSKEKLRRVLKQ